MAKFVPEWLLALAMAWCLTGYASNSPAQGFQPGGPDIEIAVISFSDGISGRLTYDALTNTSRSFFSDGSFSWTTHMGNTAFTTYSDGRTSNSNYNPITKTVTTNFSDNATATTTYNEITNTIVTHYSEGRTATINYTEFPIYVDAPVCGLHLMPEASNIIVDPDHPAVQEIRRLRELDESDREASGWIRSDG